jgi:cytochrome c553
MKNMIKKIALASILIAVASFSAAAGEQEEDVYAKKQQATWSKDCKSCHPSGRSLAVKIMLKENKKTVSDLKDFIKSGDTHHQFGKSLHDDEIESLAVFIMIHHHLMRLEKIEQDLRDEQQLLRKKLENINRGTTDK